MSYDYTPGSSGSVFNTFYTHVCERLQHTHLDHLTEFELQNVFSIRYELINPQVEELIVQV